jgi:hypothetical protein
VLVALAAALAALRAWCLASLLYADSLRRAGWRASTNDELAVDDVDESSSSSTDEISSPSALASMWSSGSHVDDDDDARTMRCERS